MRRMRTGTTHRCSRALQLFRASLPGDLRKAIAQHDQNTIMLGTCTRWQPTPRDSLNLRLHDQFQPSMTTGNTRLRRTRKQMMRSPLSRTNETTGSRIEAKPRVRSAATQQLLKFWIREQQEQEWKILFLL